MRVALTALVLSAAATTATAATPPNDGRALEIVTPDVTASRSVVSLPPILDPAGERILFETNQAEPDAASFKSRAFRLAKRSNGGWVTNDANTPTFGQAGDGTLQIFDTSTPALDRYFVTASGVDPENPGLKGVFAVDPNTGKPSRVLSGGAADAEFQNASSAGDVIYFTSAEDITPGGAAYPGPDLFRSDANGITLASDVGPSDGSWVRTSVAEFPYLDPSASPPVDTERPDIELGGFGNGLPPRPGGRGRGSASVDGESVFFTAGPSTGSELGLWLADGAQRTLLSASQRPGENGELRAARFIGASPDASIAFFVSAEPLLEGDVAGGIYRYVRGGGLERLTPEPSGPGFEGASVLTAWASEDASTLYFVSASALAPGATEGTRNAYVWHAGELRYIADLGSDGIARRASRDGRFAIFGSSSAVGGARTGGAYQVFRYSREAARLDCVSCRADGSANEGRAAITTDPTIALFDFAISAPRGLSDDGRVFFTSYDRLTADDPSGEPDVYEFADEGLRLLSGGQGASFLVDNTDDGRSVFFVSSASLLNSDDDRGDFDMYVRRAGGGFPDPPLAPLPCAGDRCQGPVSSPSVSATPGSDQPGAGNVRSARRAAVLGAPRLSAAGRRALIRGASAPVSVRLRGPGRLALRVAARVGDRNRIVARASRKVTASGPLTTRVRVRLNPAARRQLRRTGRLRVTLKATVASASRSTVVPLKRSNR